MTKHQALNQKLSQPDLSDWLIPDFLNLDVVDDKDFEVPVVVKNLSEIQAKVALGICIDWINKTKKKIETVKNLL